MKVSVTLSANAGVAVAFGGRRIWVDALHTNKVPGFSTLTPQLQGQMLQCDAFQRPEWICYTHDHPDHYSQDLTRVAQKLWPQASVMYPNETWNEKRMVSDGGLLMQFIRLPHEGEQYAGVLHYGIIIGYQGRILLIPGDCAVGSEALAAAVEGMHIDAALLDFPWLTLRKGRAFAEKYLSDSNIILYHLPFAEDDVYGYRASAARAADQWPGALLLMDPLQTIALEL